MYPLKLGTTVRKYSYITDVKYTNRVGRGDVGRLVGESKITLRQSCRKPGIILHEIMHVLGFYHEQSRPDRDNYVKINYNNIEPGRKIGKINDLIRVFVLKSENYVMIFPMSMVYKIWGK